MRSPGADGRSTRRPAVAKVPSVCGPLGFSRPRGAILFSGELAKARQPGSSDPGGGRNIKWTLMYSQSLNQAGGPFEARQTCSPSCTPLHRHRPRATGRPE